MLATSNRYPELVTMLCPLPMGMRADLLVKKLLARITSATAPVRLQSFYQQLSGSGLSAALATED